MKPKWLKETAIAMCFLNLAGFVFVDRKVVPIEVQVILFSLIVAFSYIVLWFYWQGKNWARILVLVTSAIALINLFGLPALTMLQRAVVVIEAALAVFLFWWLNTKAVREYFKSATKGSVQS